MCLSLILSLIKYKKNIFVVSDYLLCSGIDLDPELGTMTGGRVQLLLSGERACAQPQTILDF